MAASTGVYDRSWDASVLRSDLETLTAEVEEKDSVIYLLREALRSTMDYTDVLSDRNTALKDENIALKDKIKKLKRRKNNQKGKKGKKSKKRKANADGYEDLH